MQRLKDLLMSPIAAFVISDRSVGGDNPDAKRIGFNRHHLERPAAWDTVAVGFEANGLVFIHLGLARHIRIKRILWQR